MNALYVAGAWRCAPLTQWPSRANRSFFVLWAYLYMAIAYNAMGDASEALDLAGEVVDPGTGINLDQAAALSPEYAKQVFDRVETAYRLIAEVHRMAGEDDKADAAIHEMREWLRSAGLPGGTGTTEGSEL